MLSLSYLIPNLGVAVKHGMPKYGTVELDTTNPE